MVLGRRNLTHSNIHMQRMAKSSVCITFRRHGDKGYVKVIYKNLSKAYSLWKMNQILVK